MQNSSSKTNWNALLFTRHAEKGATPVFVFSWKKVPILWQRITEAGHLYTMQPITDVLKLSTSFLNGKPTTINSDSLETLRTEQPLSLVRTNRSKKHSTVSTLHFL